MYLKNYIILFLGLITTVGGLKAQVQVRDTLKLTIRQAEDQFIKNNLQLIIQHYNIDNAQAQVITARLFSNPDFNASTSVYNGSTKRIFDYRAGNDEYAGSIAQLFTTAGKRNKSIQLAKIGVQQSQYQFFDLLRTLKYALRDDFFTICFQQQSAKVYDEEISSLARILAMYKAQYAKGNIAKKEVLRIQSLLYSLQSELTSLLVSIDTTQSQFKLLIRAKRGTYIVPQYGFEPVSKQNLTSIPYQELLDSAYNNRYDLKLARSTVDYNNLNLKLQKANAIPDVTFSIGYDKRGSFIQDYNYAGIAFPLPFFNRNQGGIKQARIAVNQSKLQYQSQQDLVESDVATNYQVALRYETLYKSFDPQFKGEFINLIQEVFKNYEKRNISLLEFLDFYDSYKINTIQLNSLQLNRVISLEQLNYATGTPFFNQK